MSAYQLAQLNIGIIRGPMDSPIMTAFAANLECIKRLELLRRKGVEPRAGFDYAATGNLLTNG